MIVELPAITAFPRGARQLVDFADFSPLHAGGAPHTGSVSVSF